MKKITIVYKNGKQEIFNIFWKQFFEKTVALEIKMRYIIDISNNYYFKGGIIMQKYVCEPCGYVYDPEVGDPDNGIAPGTPFEALPEDWVCPICGVGKEEFKPE